MNLTRPIGIPIVGLLTSLALVACGNEVSSDEQARRAYVGLDKAIAKSLELGFQGFKEAGSANIPVQTTTGNAGGTLTVSGQVDQGASKNKEMRLRVGMVDYSDGVFTVPDEDEELSVTYQTATDASQQPALELSVRNIPNGTFTGTLSGSFQMSGDVEGEVTLNLTFDGLIEDDGSGSPRRKAGETTVTGTARAGDGEYAVDVTL